MSFKALTYTQSIKLFRQKAKSLISALPKGVKQAAGRMLQNFLQNEKTTLHKWYGGMLLHVLDEEDFTLLLATKKKGLHFRKLDKAGLDKEAVSNLREELFGLLKTTCIDSSGVGLNAEMKYKVRLYRLPEREVTEVPWETWEERHNPQLLN